MAAIGDMMGRLATLARAASLAYRCVVRTHTPYHDAQLVVKPGAGWKPAEPREERGILWHWHS